MVEVQVAAASVTEDNEYDYIYEVSNGNPTPALREDGGDPANRQSGIRR